MKKNILLIALFGLFIGSKAKAQDIIYGGLKIAPNYSVFTESVPESDKWKSGLGFGLGYYEVLELSNNINMQAELLINKNTFIKETTAGNRTTKIKKSTTNFNLPIMVKYRGENGFSIGAGYQFGLGAIMKSKLKTKTTVTENNKSTDSEEEEDGVANNGLLIDASVKQRNSTFGLRILVPSKEQISTYMPLNASLYFAYSIF